MSPGVAALGALLSLLCAPSIPEAQTTTTAAVSSTTTTTLPPALRCQQKAARAAQKYAVAVLRCEAKAKRSQLKGKAFNLNRCREKQQRQYERNLPDSIDNERCLLCIGDGATDVKGRIEFASALGTHVLCDLSSDRATIKCAGRMTRLLGRLINATVNCRVKAAKRAFRTVSFSESNCVTDALRQYEKTAAKVRGCPSCFDAATRQGLAQQVVTTVRRNNRSGYCGCQYWPSDSPEASCDDDNGCTTDQCTAAGECSHTAVAGAGNCPDDGNVCTTDACVNGVCTHKAATGAASCPDDGNVCTQDICRDGVCVHPQEAAGTSCDDGDLCTEGDTCVGGQCRAGEPLDCGGSDGQCRASTCDPDQGCVVTNISGSCEDGSACTVGDRCVDGRCRPGGLLDCDDNDECTTDTCSQDTGCIHTPIACNDGDLCTSDMCVPGLGCVHTEPIDCDDGDLCTIDACIVDNDVIDCLHMPVEDCQ